MLDVVRPTRGVGAALDKERFKAGMGQSESSKEARATHAYDDGSRDGTVADCVGLREVRLVTIDEMDVLASGFIERLHACELLGAVRQLNACA